MAGVMATLIVKADDVEVGRVALTQTPTVYTFKVPFNASKIRLENSPGYPTAYLILVKAWPRLDWKDLTPDKVLEKGGTTGWDDRGYLIGDYLVLSAV